MVDIYANLVTLSFSLFLHFCSHLEHDLNGPHFRLYAMFWSKINLFCFLLKKLHMARRGGEGHSFPFRVVQMVIGIQEGPPECVQFLERKLQTVQPTIVPCGNTLFVLEM